MQGCSTNATKPSIRGIEGLSETARVVSIVGRFLEHTRVYYFRNGGEDEYYIGSADLMKRNLESRVEVVTPVEDSEMRDDLRLLLDIQLADQRCAWDMQADGSYRQRLPQNSGNSGCQETLIKLAESRLAAKSTNKKKKWRKKLIQFQSQLADDQGG